MLVRSVLTCKLVQRFYANQSTSGKFISFILHAQLFLFLYFFACVLVTSLKVHCTVSRMLYSMAARIIMLQSFVTAATKVESVFRLFFALFVCLVKTAQSQHRKFILRPLVVYSIFSDTAVV